MQAKRTPPKNLIIDKPAIDSIIQVPASTRRGTAPSIILPNTETISKFVWFSHYRRDAVATKATPPFSGRCPINLRELLTAGAIDRDTDESDKANPST